MKLIHQEISDERVLEHPGCHVIGACGFKTNVLDGLVNVRFGEKILDILLLSCGLAVAGLLNIHIVVFVEKQFLDVVFEAIGFRFASILQRFAVKAVGDNTAGLKVGKPLDELMENLWIMFCAMIPKASDDVDGRGLEHSEEEICEGHSLYLSLILA